MMKISKNSILVICTLFSLVLMSGFVNNGSSPAVGLQQVPTSALDPLRTEIAQTIIAQITAAAQTATPAAMPTATLIPVKVVTQVPYYKCTITKQWPEFGKVNALKAGEDFDAVWTVRNDGRATWNNNFDYIFFKGDKLQKFGDLYDFGAEVKPEGRSEIRVDMKAPTTPGYYRTWWRLLDEWGTTVCTVYVSIKVVE